ncbi:MAG: hypothetical protein JRH20_20525, partial [Deltaproteobacteria bacterium]|nr:hypothetical protein [Deltaproteobacteria bacterium]
MQGRTSHLLALIALSLCTLGCTFDSTGPAVAPPLDAPIPLVDFGRDAGPGDGRDLSPDTDGLSDGPGPEVAPPDSTVDMPPGVILDNYFTEGPGTLTFEEGDWSWDEGSGGNVHQSSTEDNGLYALFDASASTSIGAETTFRINAIEDVGISEAAALGFRVRPPTVAGVPPKMV